MQDLLSSMSQIVVLLFKKWEKEDTEAYNYYQNMMQKENFGSELIVIHNY